MKRLLLAALALIPALLFAQPQPDTLWTRTYTDRIGQTAWDLQLCYDGGFLLGGERIDSASGFAARLIRTLPDGTVAWTRDLGEGADFMTVVGAKESAQDSTIWVGGDRYADNHTRFYLNRLTADGQPLWARTYGVEHDPVAADMAMLPGGGGAVLFGSADGLRHFYAVRTDAAGDTVWTRVYNHDRRSQGFGMTLCRDGGLAMVGSATVDEDHSYCIIVRTDAAGQELWQQALIDSGQNAGRGVIETADGGFVIVGATTQEWEVPMRLAVWKLNSAGERQWRRTFPVYRGWADRVLEHPDGGYVVGATVQSTQAPATDNMMLLRLNAEGGAMWQRQYGSSDNELLHAMVMLPNGSYVLAGIRASYPDEWYSMYLVKTGMDALDVPTLPRLLPEIPTLAAYPNPFNASTTLSFTLSREAHARLTLVDVQGREAALLEDGPLAAGDHAVRFDGSALASGTYFAHLTTPQGQCIQKVILLK
jgi:hypothetical protein